MDNKVIDEHLYIKDEEELADYLEKHFKTKWRDFDFEIDQTYNDYIYGYINNLNFEIHYIAGDSCSILIDSGFTKEKNELTKVLQPVMWNIKDTTHNPAKYSGVLASYTSKGGFDAVEWDTYDPIRRLKHLGVDYFNKVKQIMCDFKMCYPHYSLEQLKEDVKYGNCKEGFPDVSYEQVDNLSEKNTFIYLKKINNAINSILDNGDMDFETKFKLESYIYQQQYLMHSTKKFGVKVNEPSNLPVKPTDEFIAWYVWWDKFTEIMDKEKITKENSTIKKMAKVVKQLPCLTYEELIPSYKDFDKKTDVMNIPMFRPLYFGAEVRDVMTHDFFENEKE